jgi:hypothetical protein
LPELVAFHVAWIDRPQPVERIACFRGTVESDEGTRARQKVTRIRGTLAQSHARQLHSSLGMIRPQLDVDAGEEGVAMRRIAGQDEIELMTCLVIAAVP